MFLKSNLVITALLAFVASTFLPTAFADDFLDRLEEGNLKGDFSEKRRLKSAKKLASQADESARFRFPNGDEYQGEWLNGKPHGEGLLVTLKGDRYLGEFENGLFHGYGEMHYGNGDVYEGEWVRGMPNGEGTLNYKSGNYYEGQWLLGKRSGIGQLKFASGSVYEGEWKNDNRHGQGKMIHRTGDRYIGDYAFNKPHGNGVQISSSGQAYRGTFSKGKKHGVGECFVGKEKARTCVFDRGIEIQNETIVAKAEKLESNKPINKPYSGGLDFVFEDDFTKRPEYVRHEKVWWETTVALLSTQLRILSSSSKGDLLLIIEKYQGPGRYELDKGQLRLKLGADGSVGEEGAELELATNGEASVVITTVEGNKISGEFYISLLGETNSDSQTFYTVRNGRFKASKSVR